MMVGGCDDMLILLWEPPMSSVSSSLTILMTTCDGVSDSMTSCPIALSVTRLTKSFTTLKFTSASKRAIRTSFMAALTSSSVSLPCPLSFLNVSCSLSAKPSKINLIPPGQLCRYMARALSVYLLSAAEPYQPSSGLAHRKFLSVHDAAWQLSGQVPASIHTQP